MVLVTTQTPTFTRKLLMAALNPAALFWLGMLAGGLLALVRFRRSSLALLLAGTLCFGIGSNGLVGRWAIRSLERDLLRVRSAQVGTARRADCPGRRSGGSNQWYAAAEWKRRPCDAGRTALPSGQGSAADHRR